MKEQSHFQRGQTIVLRDIWQNRIWSVRPAIVVQDQPELMAFYIHGGSGTTWIRAKALDDTPVTIENRLQLEWQLEDAEQLELNLLRTSKLQSEKCGYFYLVFK